MSHYEPTNADLDLGDALLDAVRFHLDRNLAAAASRAIPAVKSDPIKAASFLAEMVCVAVRAYAKAADIDPPTAALDALWSKPARDGAS